MTDEELKVLSLHAVDEFVASGNPLLNIREYAIFRTGFMWGYQIANRLKELAAENK